MTDSRWHRRVSPIFFLLILVAGLMIGFAAFYALAALAGAIGG